METAPSADFHETSLAPLWDFRPRDVDAGRGRALEDLVETGCYSFRIIAVVVAIAAIILVGGFFLWLPLCLDFPRRISST